MIYFAPESAASYTALGLPQEAGYFASRSAPMGAVTAATVVATFFNFAPSLVHAAIPRAWETAPPVAVLAARLAAADAALRRMLGDAVRSAEMARAAELARRAAERGGERYEGRPLFAGHAGLPWPDEPHLVLWHAQTLLREFRGDGHVATLLQRGITPVEALVLHVASGEVPFPFSRDTRGWSSDQWTTGTESARDRGWLADSRGDDDSSGTARPQPARHGIATGDRGHHRPTGDLAVRGARRRSLRRAPHTRTPFQQGGGGRGRSRILTRSLDAHPPEHDPSTKSARARSSPGRTRTREPSRSLNHSRLRRWRSCRPSKRSSTTTGSRLPARSAERRQRESHGVDGAETRIGYQDHQVGLERRDQVHRVTVVGLR